MARRRGLARLLQGRLGRTSPRDQLEAVGKQWDREAEQHAREQASARWANRAAGEEFMTAARQRSDAHLESGRASGQAAMNAQTQRDALGVNPDVVENWQLLTPEGRQAMASRAETVENLRLTRAGLTEPGGTSPAVDDKQPAQPSTPYGARTRNGSFSSPGAAVNNPQLER